MHQKQQLIKSLNEYLPEETANTIATWIFTYKVEFKISKPRSTKLGDFRPSWKGKPARISVNDNLNKFSFLITTVHEFAHLVVWNKYKRTVKPHGKEWKETFSAMLKPFIVNGIFPNILEKALKKYIANPLASSYSDLNLSRTLKEFDAKVAIHLEDLKEGSTFRIRNKIFIKGTKRRKRYICQEISSKKIYLVSALAEIEIL